MGVLFLAGSSSAIHIGKVPAALPALSADLELSLLGSGSIVSLFSVLVGILGSLVGLAAANLAYRNAAIIGLLLASVASITGAFATSYFQLIVSRAAEGFGWILVAVSVPTLMVTVSAFRHRPLVLGLWGAFFPTGAAFALWLSPWILETSSWRGLWICAGIATGIGALLIYLTTRSLSSTNQSADAQRRNEPKWYWLDLVYRLSRKPALICLLICFCIYSAQFAAVTGFLPTVLLQDDQLSLRNAAWLSALVMLANVVGNVLSGVLLSTGIQRQRIIVFALTMMMLLGSAFFVQQIPLSIKVAAAVGFTAIAGLIPGTLFATAPLMVPQLSMVGVVNGLLLQAAGLGQFIGPIALAGLVEFAGSWSSGMLFIAVASGIGIIAMSVFKRVFVEQSESYSNAG